MSKNIIVSGASSGIGYQVAIQFAREGHQVLVISRRKEKLAQLQSEHGNISILAVDLNDLGLEQKIREYYKGDKKVDVIINNAGQLINKTFMETQLHEFAEQYNSNVLSAINLIQSCHTLLNEGSHIVNISSMGGFQGSSKFSGLSAYSASKGALSILTECLAEEFKEISVSVNALALGAVQTEMLKKAFPDYTAPLSPERIATYIVQFALNGNEFYNGKVLPVTLGDP